MNAIEVRSITKIYQTVPTTGRAYVRGMKEQGPGLWIKNLLKLKTQKMRRVIALNEVSFDVKMGEIFAIVGPNGAGKTSLIKILSGLLYPTSGNAKILGTDLVREHEKIKDKIAYVSTSGWMGLEWQLTVYENLLFYADLMRMTRKKAKSKIGEVVSALGMESYVEKTVPQLSAGMREMVTLARGLMAERPIIYLDEPTTSLDPFAREKFWKYVLTLRMEKACTIIFSSHDPSEIEGYADRIMFLKNGKVLQISCPAEIIEEFSKVKIYQADLSNFKIRRFPPELVEVIDIFSLSDSRVKMRFLLKGKLNDFVDFLVSNGATIHNISRDSPKISDAYVRITKDE